ncbi:nucleotidyltransferase domain-containing protein [Candidatus Woesearchaeota archaeon]|nr:nucleotidyltransferase domain-containing protein [Candidatus Woesearchaeota archaeon]
MKLTKNAKKRIIGLLKRNGVVKAGLFGSYARGDATKKSDINILIKLKGDKSLLDIVGLKQELERNIKKKVDIVTYKSINHLIKKDILKEELRLYD